MHKMVPLHLVQDVMAIKGCRNYQQLEDCVVVARAVHNSKEAMADMHRKIKARQKMQFYRNRKKTSKPQPASN